MLLVAPFLTTLTLAAYCNPDDIGCDGNQKQLQTLGDSDLKPTSVLKMSAVAAPSVGDQNDNSSKLRMITEPEPKPFVIPPPVSAASATKKDSSNFNLAAPSLGADASTADQGGKSNGNDAKQESAATAAPVNVPQQIGIYR